MKYTKLSEKLLPELIKTLFPNHAENVKKQHRIKGFSGELMIIDVALDTGDDIFFFEFDGPTHYQLTKTQIRDNTLADFCNFTKIKLIRFPYFAQFGKYDIHIYFSDEDIEKYQLFKTSENLECDYKWGFYDTKIVYPSDYNQTGWELFYNFYCKLAKKDAFYNMQSIYESLVERDDLDVRYTIGLDYKTNEEKEIFVREYPT